jgi:hypothetical protein
MFLPLSGPFLSPADDLIVFLALLVISFDSCFKDVRKVYKIKENRRLRYTIVIAFLFPFAGAEGPPLATVFIIADFTVK